MPQITKRKLANSALLLLIGALIAWDIYAHQAQTFFVGTAGSVQQAQEPLQVEGLPSCAPALSPWARAIRLWRLPLRATRNWPRQQP